MSATDPILVVDDERYREHIGPRGHPEQPDRLIAVRSVLEAFSDRIERIVPRGAERDEIERVHSAAHVRAIEEAVRWAPGRLDADTYVSERSYDVALLAAGGTIELASRLAQGAARCGLAAVRPPGHHAESTHAMGFCLFNNVAIAARALQAEHGVGKLMILDWDVHHGNGTQHCFEEDPSVLYVSTHQYPYYPGTGDVVEIGRGRGEGATVNVPMPPGCGDDEYVGVLQRIVVPVARAFAPEMILVSCGFDAHRDDPLAAMDVSGEGFLGMSRIIRALADDLCDGRVLFTLEGGYASSGLSEGSAAVLTAMHGAPGAWPAAPDAGPGSLLGTLVDRVAAVHSDRYRHIGAA